MCDTNYRFYIHKRLWHTVVKSEKGRHISTETLSCRQHRNRVEQSKDVGQINPHLYKKGAKRIRDKIDTIVNEKRSIRTRSRSKSERGKYKCEECGLVLGDFMDLQEHYLDLHVITEEPESDQSKGQSDLTRTEKLSDDITVNGLDDHQVRNFIVECEVHEAPRTSRTLAPVENNFNVGNRMDENVPNIATSSQKSDKSNPLVSKKHSLKHHCCPNDICSGLYTDIRRFRNHVCQTWKMYLPN